MKWCKRFLPAVDTTAWSLAGTVYESANAEAEAGLEGAEVQVTDQDDVSFSLRTNLTGNFYTSEPLAFPLKRVCVERGGGQRCMQATVANGSCNTCHSNPPHNAAPGRLSAP